MQGPKFLTAEQLLLTTLVVKLVATAALATMLVRYRRFRHILIFERRAWPDRLTFALSLGIPRVIVPLLPGALSAYGILVSDVVKDYSRTLMLQLGTKPPLGTIRQHFAELNGTLYSGSGGA